MFILVGLSYSFSTLAYDLVAECKMNAQLSKLLEHLPREPKSLTWTFLVVASVLYLLYWIGQIIYRLTLHPLARFPGPFLCRIGYLQQCYYEAILNGKFLERLPEYHRKYGKSLSPVEIRTQIIRDGHAS